MGPFFLVMCAVLGLLLAPLGIVDRKNPGKMQSKWLAGSLVFYPGDSGPGDEYFVNSTLGDDTNTGLSWAQALATTDAAVDLCTADHGDKIYLAPYHAETLAAASDVDADVDGISIIGCVQGRQMPTFNGTATGADFKVAGDRVTIQNIRFTGGVDAMTGILEITGDDAAVFDIEYRDVTGQATDIIVTDNAMRLLIDGVRIIGAAADGGDSAIFLDECDHAVIRNFHIIGNFDVGAIECRTTASDDILIEKGYVKTYGSEDLIIADTVTGSTGFVDKITCEVADNAANITEAVAGATFTFGNEIYVANLAGERAMQTNLTASTDA